MELYTIEEAAQQLKTGKGTIYAMIRKGVITPLKLGRVKIPDYELERWSRANLGKRVDINDPSDAVPMDPNDLR
jgi:excisionase family DNA binding protein